MNAPPSSSSSSTGGGGGGGGGGGSGGGAGGAGGGGGGGGGGDGNFFTTTHAQSGESFILHLLTKGWVVSAPPPTAATSLKLPSDFWGTKDVKLTPELMDLLSKELEWTAI